MNNPIDAYQQLACQVDGFFEKVKERYPGKINCSSGCSDCCRQDLSLFPFEIDMLMAAFKGLSDDQQQEIIARAKLLESGKESACVFLENDRCLVYESRPMLCRTQGLPLLVTEGEQGLSICDQNLVGVDNIDGDCVLKLDLVNHVMATVHHLVIGSMGERIKVSRAILNHFQR
jgi:hypothetical protein